ncbi:MAG: LysM peptidoglycan-binding domain-containing protein [Phycisphaeraceae bacterium]|nr:LysM peptidoglycan-binding domain-containing protein [Phycisphaeraceae bacterium]
MNKAWIAVSLAAVALVGCKSDTEPVSQVPAPNYATEPEPLPPVAINQGNPGTVDPVPGNVSGPGAYEPEPLPPQPVSRTYTIRKGDTLWSIAQREYGDGQKWRDISAANPSVDPKKLAVGQQITLP